MSTTAQATYYDTLGVSSTATADEIRKAYLKLAHLYHPDKTGGDKSAENRLKEINAAYDTLKNADKRKQYDLELEAKSRGFEGFSGREGFDGAGFNFGGGGFGGFEDLFGSIFGGQTGPGRAPAAHETGSDLEGVVSITLEEAFAGTRKTLRLRRPENCGTCHGSGAQPGTSPQRCATCSGSGQVHQERGPFSMRTSCPRCQGTGEEIASPCGTCRGTGQIKAERSISVEIPAGVESGARLRLAAQGGAARHGGVAGDLYVQIRVQTHEMFERKGADIVCEVPLSFAQAALGDKVKVPTLTGVAELNIPEGTQHGAQFRMRGQGMPKLQGSGRGDQLVRVAVEVPVKLNARQRELLREFSGGMNDENAPRSRGFLNWLKLFRKL